MKIEEITSQHRRDFIATFICEHCGDTYEGVGYDDTNFHNVVLPGRPCQKCGKKAPENYRPFAPLYPDGKVV